VTGVSRIRPASIEVARLEELSKVLGRQIIARQTFAKELADPWECLGRHRLRGVDWDIEVYCMPETGDGGGPGD